MSDPVVDSGGIRARAEKLSLATMTALVVGSMVGAGVFSLPRRFAQETGVAGALVAWAVAGAGTLMLALVFSDLAVRRPDLDAGIYAYARAGFGEYLGFLSAIGYWASACAGNVTFLVLIASTLSTVVPALGDGDTPLAGAGATALLWAIYALLLRGVREATALNRVATVAKLIPIGTFVLLALFALDPGVFAENWSGDPAGSLVDQVRGTMLVTVFVFLGVEGASVYSRHARRRADVGRATVLGFCSVFCLFASVTIVSYGVLPQREIAALEQPSMAGVLDAAVGPWGSALVRVGLVISVLGASLAWTLSASEVLFATARGGDLPGFVRRRDSRTDVPTAALLLTSVLVQVLLVLVLFSENAFDVALELTSALILVPYLLSAGFALRLAAGGAEDRGPTRAGRGWTLVVAALGTAYALFLLVAAGPTLLAVSLLIYAPASVLFALARREQGRRPFEPGELAVLAVAVLGAASCVVALAAGWISL